jgi:outer membrane receptor protein involved in Fe transport
VVLAGPVSLDLAGRYDRVALTNRDRITPGGGTGSLDSNPVYQRFNPAATLGARSCWLGSVVLVEPGLARALGHRTGLFRSRKPLSPAQCPGRRSPLAQVVARTLELRFDGVAGPVRVHVSLFRTDSSDDILFVADNASGYGYFRNFGKTRRQGIEVSADARLGKVALGQLYAARRDLPFARSGQWLGQQQQRWGRTGLRWQHCHRAGTTSRCSPATR